MSKRELSQWLLSHRSDKASGSHLNQVNLKQTKVAAIASGKGGVGKTTLALQMAQQLGKEGYKVLLIDCDYNLSNTAVKLGLPLNDNFFSLLSMEKTFDECVAKLEDVHLLTGCNGNSDLFDKSFELDRFIIDIITSHGNDYDYVFLDCPAGIQRETVNLAAYADYRLMVINPDASSITDTYALIKILNQRYSIKQNHLVANRIQTKNQFERVSKSLLNTVSSFLSADLKVLGAVPEINDLNNTLGLGKKDQATISVAEFFAKIVNRFTEESTGSYGNLNPLSLNSNEHDVQQFSQSRSAQCHL
jgi:flagellar biosynthesis protein FlhG